MIKINDGKTQFHQWDINQKLTVDNPDIKELHYTNAAISKALVVEVIDGTANVPNILLQYDFDIKVYGFCGECVRDTATFNVVGRAKPEDYVYTEIEIKTWDSLKEELEEEIKELEEEIKNIEVKPIVTDIYANALRGTASGGAVTLNVSPIEHTLGVKARGKNIFDISKFTTTAPNKTVYISEVGENYIVITKAEGSTSNGYTVTNKKLRDICPEIEVGKTYTLTGTTDSATNKYIYVTGLTWLFGKSATITQAMYDGDIVLYGFTKDEPVGECRIENIQIEEGTVATPYTPYVADITTANVLQIGDNLLPYPYRTFANQDTVGKAGIYITDNKDGSVRIKGTSTSTETFILAYMDLGGNWTDASSGLASATTKDGKYTISKYLLYDHTKKTVNIAVKSGLTVDEVIYPQVNIGDKLLPYTPYTETPYPINEDGIVEGVKSVYPTTMLKTSVDGVVIDVEYNKDINKAFEELIQAIISLGGNV